MTSPPRARPGFPGPVAQAHGGGAPVAGRGGRITARILIIVGVAVLIGGVIVAYAGNTAHASCVDANHLTQGITAPTNCSSTVEIVGAVVLAAGLVMLVLGFLLQYVERTTQ